MARTEKYDIAIVGGGLVGASLACALAPLGYRVVVLEKTPRRAASQPSYDDRTLALSHSSCKILESLGLWPELSAHATPIRQIIATELGRPGRVEMTASEMGLEAFGNVVEARAFGSVILDRLEQMDEISVHCPAAVSQLECKEGSGVLTVSDSDTPIEARLVVAADGAASVVREMMGIKVETRDYEQTAVICNITPEQPHNGRAFERLTATGPFAVLPHAGTRCGLVWSMETEEAARAMEMDEASFLEAAHERFGNDLGRFVKMGRRSSYPLKLVRALQDIHQRVVVIGNAAHTIHPVGAQGFNLGLRDVAVLAEVLADPAVGDPGNEATLKAYSEWRQPDQQSTVAWSDGMTRMFANPSPIMATLRSAGMFAHALIPSLRRRLASSAMGYRGKVPKMALGEKLARSKKIDGSVHQ